LKNRKQRGSKLKIEKKKLKNQTGREPLPSGFSIFNFQFSISHP